MATLTELTALLGDPGALEAKIRGALLIEAQIIVANGSATALQKAWARACFEDVNQFRTAAYAAVLAANNAQTVAVIQGATDAQVQTAVHAVIPILTG